MDSLDTFTHKSLITTPYTLTYSYYLSPDFASDVTSTNKPILMLLHGFPDDAHMWAQAIPVLQPLGYPLLIPDLLGFGGSSKPTEPARYNYKDQANSLAQILDNEGVNAKHRVIPIGHDWGSLTAQRFYLYHKQRCQGLAILSLAYQIPTPDKMNLDKENEQTAKRFGYPQWEYWNFFTAPDAPEIMRQDIERFWEVNNGLYMSDKPGEEGRDIWMREMFCVPGGMRDYMLGRGKWEGKKKVQLKDYPEGERQKQRFIERMSRDGFEGPVCYYHSLKESTMLDDEKELCEKGTDGKDKRNIDVPMLYIGQTGDWVCRTDLMSDAKKQGLVDDLEEKVVDAGHWCLYEKGEEIGGVLAEWLTKRFPVQK